MARLATQADFEGLNPDSLYSNYHKYAFFAQRADWLLSLHDRLRRANVLTTTPAQTKVIVAGAAYGYLVEELIWRGFDAIGFDASDYAINKMTTSVDLTARGRMFKRDMLNSSDYNALKTSHNLRRNDKWHITITEDVLPCLSDAEVAQAIPFVRNAAHVLVHILTPGQFDAAHVADMNWKTMNEWRTFLTPISGVMPDWLLNTEGNAADPLQIGSLEYPPDGWVEPV